MSAALDRIQAKAGDDHCCQSCSRDGCRVDLNGAPSLRVIVDADSAFRAHGVGGKRCDFILFLSGGGRALVVAPIELKSGNVDASEAVDQLRAGAAFADRLSRGEDDADCQPILFHGKSIHRKQRADLARGKVNFRGRKLTVKTARCGQPGNLASTLSG